MANVNANALVELDTDHFGMLRSFLPDTPWTTRPSHALERRTGKVLVDSVEQPNNIVVTASAHPSRNLPDQAWLFGRETAIPLIEFLQNAKRPIEIVCDDDLAPLVIEHLPGAVPTDHSVHWFDSLDSEFEVDRVDGLRRLRGPDADAISKLPLTPKLRTFANVRDLLMSGGGYGVMRDDKLVCAALTVDLSVNFARVTVATDPEFARQGLATAAVRRLISAHRDEGRLGCAIVKGRDPIGEALVVRSGFAKAARLRTYLAN